MDFNRLRQALSYRPFLILLALGAALRVGLMVLYFPAVMLMYDSPRYARVDAMPLFGDFWMPAGYPMFLALLRGISNQLWFTIAVQHLLGLFAGTFVYLSLCRLELPRWSACIPAAVVWLAGDHLYLEHMIMADSLVTFSVAAGLCAAVFGLTAANGRGWLAVSSVCLGAVALVRSVGVICLPVLCAAALFWPASDWPKHAQRFAVALIPGTLVFCLYFGAFKITRGQYLGLSDMRGWNLYCRVAPFADCRKFTPPPGTEVLCETRKPRRRPGPFGYVWDLESVPRKTFELGPETGRQLGAFAREAIVHQPKHYVHAVAIDLARYVNHAIGGKRRYGGQPPEILSFGWRSKEVEDFVVETMARVYRGTSVTVRAPRALATYQKVIRLHGPLVAAAFIIAVAGFFRAQGRLRLGIWLFGAITFGLYFIPVATYSWDFRYGIPPQPFLAAAGVLGAAALFPRAKGGTGSLT